MTRSSDHHAPLRSRCARIKLDYLCIGLLRQCRRTRVIERLASVSFFFNRIWGPQCLLNVNVIG